MIKPITNEQGDDKFFNQYNPINEDVNEKRVKNFHLLNQVKHKQNNEEKTKIK